MRQCVGKPGHPAGCIISNAQVEMRLKSRPATSRPLTQAETKVWVVTIVISTDR
jgi:hypothetical protein